MKFTDFVPPFSPALEDFEMIHPLDLLESFSCITSIRVIVINIIIKRYNVYIGLCLNFLDRIFAIALTAYIQAYVTYE
jgi:hypothetical protein